MKINYKSDFHFFLDLKDCRGNDIGFPGFDWSAVLYTVSRANVVKASCVDGVCTNCFNDNGRIHVVMNSHGMSAGQLKAEIHAQLPNDIFPDGFELEVSPEQLDIELVHGKGDCATAAAVELVLPVIKGDKGDAFTFTDFTQEQIAELQRPATEAATEAAKAVDILALQVSDVVAKAETAAYNAANSAERADNAAATADNAALQAQSAATEASRAATEAFDSSVLAKKATYDAENTIEQLDNAELMRVAAESERVALANRLASQAGNVNVTINFGQQQTIAQDVNMEIYPLKLMEVKTQNISHLWLTAGDMARHDIVADNISEVFIPANTVITLEIERIKDNALAYAFFRYNTQYEQ